MTFEKSCGAVVFRNDRTGGRFQRYVLMIKHSLEGHYSFPKGHVEVGENEIMTAEREVFEETAVRIHINERFRQPVYYRPKPGVKKQVIYFVAFTRQTEISPREGEVAVVEWIPVERALDCLVHNNDKHVFERALEYGDGKRNERRRSVGHADGSDTNK